MTLLTVMVGETSVNRPRYCGASYSFAGIGLSGRIIEGFKTAPAFSGRSPYDYIKSLGRIDTVGNNAVVHQTVDGTLAVSPVINGTLRTSGGVTTSKTDVEDIMTQPTDPYGYAILNYGHLAASRLYRENSNIRASFGVLFGDLVDNRPGTGYAYCSARWLDGKFMGASIGYSISGDTWSLSWDLPDLGKRSDRWLDEAREIWKSFKCNVPVSAGKAALRAFLLNGGSQRWSNRYGKNFSCTVPPFRVSTLWARLRRGVNISQVDIFDSASKSTLARDAIEGLNSFDSNLLLYASDLRKTGDSIKSLLGLARNFRSPKAWADAWLSGRFGDRLTISDTRELFKSIQTTLHRRLPYSQGRASTSTSLVYTHGLEKYPINSTLSYFIIAYNDSYNGLMTAVDHLMKWDAWPTLENTWDAVPLSFVVDWFLPVQQLLGQIDAAVESPYIRPKSQYMGRRTLVQINVSPTSACPFAGQAVARFYTRHAHGVIGDVRPFDVVATPPSFSVVNIGDALALLVQTSKKA